MASFARKEKILKKLFTMPKFGMGQAIARPMPSSEKF
jgi:hypothetical protein